MAQQTGLAIGAGLFSRLSAWMDARLNPFLVVGLRAAMRGKRFVFVLILALAGPLLLFAGTALPSYDQSATNGGVFSASLLGGLGFVAMFLVPFGVGTALREAIASRIWELVQITKVSPWQTASGYLQVALIEFLLLICLVFPFAVVGYLLGGVGLVNLIAGLLIVAGACVLLSSLSLLSSALLALGPGYRMWARLGPSLVLLTALVASTMISGFSASLVAPGAPGADWLAFDSTSDVLIALAALIVVGLLAALMVRLSADVLSPVMRRRHLGSQLLALVLLSICALGAWLAGSPELYVVGVLVFLHFALVWALLPAWQSPLLSGFWRRLNPFGGGYWRMVRLVSLAMVLTIPIGFGFAEGGFVPARLYDLADMGRFFLQVVSVFAFYTGLALVFLVMRDAAKRTVMQALIWMSVFVSAFSVMLGIAVVSTGFGEDENLIYHFLMPGWLHIGPYSLEWLGIDAGRLLIGLLLGGLASRDRMLVDDRS